ncbi:phytanoyl-CoA dioxygenase family protein [Pseudoalteromonas fuliginea]|uniref:phytanoyl-CoA dioxygenase family protein n=1 Tax=Pseudoalteromonas fuliginea TaxID=1872678 RepID=UPI001FD15FF2|nr:phytanoyl-CoA dioxygenase family protein [Pseudoalteromonas fuliginea]
MHWQSWDDNGYVIIPELVSKKLCEDVCNMLYERLKMDKNNPASWYSCHALKQGVMVQIFNDITMQVIRSLPQVRDVFEQLWGRKNLIVSTDRVSFNPPQTESWQFPGPNLHWDIDFNKPLTFATQGLLYLTDVAAEQGAFSCVPGFHKKIDDWLANLPKNTNPHSFNFDKCNSTPLAAKAGSLIVWRNTLPHGSCPNKGSRPRIVQYINMTPLKISS